MRWTTILLTCLLPTSAALASCPSTLNFEKKALATDETVNLCERYHGKVILIVNTASKCAFTPQYDGLEQLYREYQSRGFVVLGFPSNDFGTQEPGTEQQIKEFCRLTYSVDFPMFAKTRVLAPQADPLYELLSGLSGDVPRWNFHKYLLDREGNLAGSFHSGIRPRDAKLIESIEGLL